MRSGLRSRKVSLSSTLLVTVVWRCHRSIFRVLLSISRCHEIGGLRVGGIIYPCSVMPCYSTASVATTGRDCESLGHAWRQLFRWYSCDRRGSSPFCHRKADPQRVVMRLFFLLFILRLVTPLLVIGLFHPQATIPCKTLVGLVI